MSTPLTRASRALFRPPQVYARGEVGIGWLGLISSWAILGAGVTLSVVSLANFFTVDRGVCETFSDTVCKVANAGGAIAGVSMLIVAVVFSLFIARGFGPPAYWWAAPAVIGGVGVMLFLDAVAGSDRVPLQPVVWSGVFLVLAAVSLAVMLAQWAPALAGWTRLDGLDAREVPHRAKDVWVLALAALASAWAGGQLALFMADQLISS